MTNVDKKLLEKTSSKEQTDVSNSQVSTSNQINDNCKKELGKTTDEMIREEGKLDVMVKII